MTSGLLLPGLICTAAILLWAAALLPEYLVALLFFTAAMVLRLAPPDLVFSGFQAAAFWLVLGGFVLGASIKKVGLADRAAGLLARHLSGSWPRMVGGVVALTYALAFVMPSNMGRITLLMPIVLALADRAGLGPGTRGRTALALAVGFGTYELSGSILPANVPNLIMAGAMEAAYGLHLAWLPYFALHAPAMGLLKGALLTLFLCRLYPAAPGQLPPPAPPAPFSPAERRLTVLLLVTLLLWITDSVHGIAPAWVGLGAACLCMLPRVGVLAPEEFGPAVNVRICIYLAGILGLAALVTQSGLGAMLGRAILAVAPLAPGAGFTDFGTLVGITALLNFAVTANGVPALFTPLAQTLADAAGLPLPTVLMAQVIGYSTPLLPYQAAPIVVAMGMAAVPARDGVRLCLLLGAATALLLVPFDYAWFRLLGWL